VIQLAGLAEPAGHPDPGGRLAVAQNGTYDRDVSVRYIEAI
jgi:hypothetical protein